MSLSSSHDLLKARWMSLHVPDGSKVLDVGCGNGRRLMDLSLYVRDMEGTGVELKQRIPPQILVPETKRPTLLEFDGAHLPFEDKSFDVTTICYVLHHLNDDDARRLVHEMLRVTKTRLILLEDSRPEFSLAYRLRNWAHATEANLGYEVESKNFKQNFSHTMFKEHGQWEEFLRSFKEVNHVECVNLDPISVYKHHTMFVVEIHPQV